VDTSYQENYNKNHCWQYDIRLNNLKQDLIEVQLTQEEADSLKVTDFNFSYVDKTNQFMCREVKNFIEKHEWLGKMPHRPTHRFIATYNDKLAGVVVMATPNAFSNLLGSERRDQEKLISRGACISWSPKNLASALIMFSIRWMVKNTNYRFFTAYSDTQARELGTIYQACNFTYLGQNSGARYKYFDPDNPSRGWFSDRVFRRTNSYKKYAKELGIIWQKDWSTRENIHWEKIPTNIEILLKEQSKKHQNSCHKRCLPKKHKYVYFLGQTKAETKKLKNLFKQMNPEKIDLAYPKNRGEFSSAAVHGSKKFESNLTNNPSTCRPWPQEKKEEYYMNLKEISQKFKISLSMLYRMVNESPSFPVKNVGLKKKFIIKVSDFEQWLEKRSAAQMVERTNLPSADELLGGAY
jgi:predicted DNA-binding transcriptional regulator AlpA